MPSSNDPSVAVRELLARPCAVASSADYTLLGAVAGCYAARARDGAAALIVPLGDIPSGAAGRVTAGCELLGHMSIRVSLDDRAWSCAAAALVCRQPDLIESFAVLAADVVRKTQDRRTWPVVADVVEEWLTLLAPKGRPAAEQEAGIWGELWFIERSRQPWRLIQGWRGPERDNVDFFVDGVSAELKTSRARHRHFVSQDQVDSPAGKFPAWLLSIWVKPTAPGTHGRTVPELVESILNKVPDRGDTLRCIVRAGYSPADHAAYTMRLVVLEEPSWFAADTVPRVRTADSGISRLRYQVELDDARRAAQAQATRLWSHFHEQPYDTP